MIAMQEMYDLLISPVIQSVQCCEILSFIILVQRFFLIIKIIGKLKNVKNAFL